jgi:short-subunit dehydrogenase
MKRYLITGASRGIGRAIAEKLAADDTVLLLHGRDTVALAQTRKAVEPRCAEVVLLVHDLAKRSGVSDLIAQVGNAPIDLLVNNAGLAVVKPFTEITTIEWEQTVGVNITAPFMLTQHFANAAGVKCCKHSFYRSQERLPQLERVLHEQVCA